MHNDGYHVFALAGIVQSFFRVLAIARMYIARARGVRQCKWNKKKKKKKRSLQSAIYIYILLGFPLCWQQPANTFGIIMLWRLKAYFHTGIPPDWWRSSHKNNLNIFSMLIWLKLKNENDCKYKSNSNSKLQNRMIFMKCSDWHSTE